MAIPIDVLLSDPVCKAGLERRFWPKVDKRGDDDCWPWIAKARHRFGYGAISCGRGNVLLSHWVSWALAGGLRPPGAYILHKCDNPPCCNPKHLYIGDNEQNMADMKERGRRIGRRHSPETIQKIKAARAKNPPTQTEAARLARSAAMKRRWTDPEWRDRFSELMSGENNPRFGKRPPAHQLEAGRANHRSKNGYRHSEETKRKISESHRRRRASTD